MTLPPSDGARRVQLTGRLAVVPAASRPVSASLEMPSFGTAMADAEMASAGLFGAESDFSAAELPIAIDAPPPPPEMLVLGGGADITGEEVAAIEYQPDPDDDGVYVLVQTIDTPDGPVYEVALPETPPAAEVSFGVLGGGIPAPLRFPVRRLVGAPPAATLGDISFGIGDGIGEAARELVFRRVVNLLRAPVAPALQQLVALGETAPQVYWVYPDGSIGEPLEGAEMWRARFTPGRDYRVLVFVHGFLTNAESSLPRRWLRALAPRYDALLAYSHPTIASSPRDNAKELLAQIPADLRLRADLVAHSRGGLVVRSLVELLPPAPRLAIERVLTCGSPHAGTLLAQHHRWDRLASIGFTSASWLLAATGAAPLAFVPKLLEYLVRAGGQFFFDLPGVVAMDPGSRFIGELNTPADLRQAMRVPYAVVTSEFSPATIAQPGFRDALTALAVQAFIDAPNDLVVNTDSMSSIDLPAAPQLGGWIFKSNICHHQYFDNQPILDFAAEFLGP